MRKEDISAAMNQMNSMSPEQMAAAANVAGAQNSSQVQYKYKASEQLKAEGNVLFKSGQYSEASEKYTRAISNLEGNTSAQATTLRRMCQVNNASCCLKLSKWDEADAMCTAVLKIEPANAKALYRRAQARLQVGNADGSVDDFRAALEASPGDATIQNALRDAETAQAEQRKRVADAMAAQEDDDEEVTRVDDDDLDFERTAEPSATTSVGGVTIEELPSRHETSSQPKAVPETSTATKTTSPSEPTPVPLAARPPPMPSATTMDAQMNAMRENPEMMKSVGAMMKDMSPEQLEGLAAMAGQSGAMGGMKLDPTMMKMAGEMMSKMSPEDMEMMMKMQPPPGMGAGGMGSAQSSADDTGASASLGGGAGAAAAGTGGLGDLTPEMMAQMEKQMNDPQNMEAMTNMMQNMSPEMLMTMSKQMGKDMTEEEAAKTLDMMKGMKPETVKRMMQAAKVVKQTTDSVKKATQAFMARPALVVAGLMLLLAIVLHFFGFIG